MQRADESRPWQVLSKRVLHTSQFGIDVALWTVRLPDGTVVTDHPVLDHHRPAVAVIPVGADGRILMIERYRVITDRQGWELPAGRVDPGESVDEAARRELLEETGHSARSWATLGAYHPANGSSNQVFHILVGRELVRESDPTDRNETLALADADPVGVGNAPVDVQAQLGDVPREEVDHRPDVRLRPVHVGIGRGIGRDADVQARRPEGPAPSRPASRRKMAWKPPAGLQRAGLGLAAGEEGPGGTEAGGRSC